MKTTVNLTRKNAKANGKTYGYWVVRWFGSDGKRYSQSLGKTTELSHRQAKKRRDEKQRELDDNPGRRDVGRAPALGEFLKEYYKARERELEPGTLELHKQTGRYLMSYFGEQRKLDGIDRKDARAFKTALAGGEMAQVNKRRRKSQKLLAITTVDQHIRNARRIFRQAKEDDLITVNPFDLLRGGKPIEKDWHYVDYEEFGKLMEAARPAWKLLLALARLAGLRLEEALELPWRKIDWIERRLTVISRDNNAAEGEFQVKDKDARVVPICQDLFSVLQSASDQKSDLVIPRGSLMYKNVWRDFQVIAKRAGVASYSKPIHSLRKSRITDWAGEHPAHVVKEWAGHADIRTTVKFYLKVSESEYDKAAGLMGKLAPETDQQTKSQPSISADSRQIA